MGDESAAAFSGGHGACEVSHIGTSRDRKLKFLTYAAFRVSCEINLLSSHAGASKLIIGPRRRLSLELIMNRRSERQLHMTDYLADG